MPSTENYITQAAGDARYQALGSLGSGTPAAETPDHAGSAGVSSSASRADHVHPITADVPVAFGNTLSEGVATTFARSDHVHTGARGSVGYAESTATQSGVGAEVDVTGCSVTFTAVSGRRYRVTGRVGTATASAADTGVFVLIKDGSTEIGRGAITVSATAREHTTHAVCVVSPSAGSKTYKLTLQAVGGTIATASLAASPNFILVEDIGT